MNQYPAVSNSPAFANGTLNINKALQQSNLSQSLASRTKKKERSEKKPDELSALQMHK
jgi:hypothetical protein